jgi:hypothetical protein
MNASLTIRFSQSNPRTPSGRCRSLLRSCDIYRRRGGSISRAPLLGFHGTTIPPLAAVHEKAKRASLVLTAAEFQSTNASVKQQAST